MKSIGIVGLLAGLFLFGSACDNEVDLTAEYKDIPVVYGLLSRQDSVHYIKIQKAFLGEDGGNALEFAQVPDSIYYDNLDVKIERVQNGTTYSLERVNGNDEGYVREDGIFAEEPNYVYKLVLPAGEELVGGEAYTLRINREDGKDEITATTRIISDFIFTSPFQVTSLNLQYRNFPLAWKKSAGAVFYDIKMLIHYLEKNEAGSFEAKTLLWEIDDNLTSESGSNTFGYEFDGEEFFRFIGSELDDNDGRERIFSSLDFIVDAGGQEFFDYINIGQANTGITSSQAVPNYTNLSEGLGVFSSRNRSLYVGFSLQAASRDSLSDGIYTRDLGF